jgi:hypothetical protein
MRRQLSTMKRALARGEPATLPLLRPRLLTGNEWWEHLALEPESLTAPWARPRS